MEVPSTREQQRQAEWKAHARKVADGLPPLSAAARADLAVLLQPYPEDQDAVSAVDRDTE